MSGLLLSGDPLRSPSLSLAGSFFRAADTSLPISTHWWPLAVAVVCTGAMSLLVLSRVSTLEGVRFTRLFYIGTTSCFGLALLALGHTAALWQQTHAALTRLGRSNMAESFERVKRFNLDWRLKLWLPRRDELSMLMALSDHLESVLAERPDPSMVGTCSAGASANESRAKFCARPG